MAGQRDRDLETLANRLKLWTFVPNGTEGYAKAEVTLGGNRYRRPFLEDDGGEEGPGLFAIGEAVDVTGWLGGYNFQWAWSSGWVAGEAV